MGNQVGNWYAPSSVGSMITGMGLLIGGLLGGFLVNTFPLDDSTGFSSGFFLFSEAKTIITCLVRTGVHVNNYPLEISLPGISSTSASPACSA